VIITISNFKKLNSESEERANGLIFQIIETYKLTDRLVKALFNIGSNRLLRIKNNEGKKKGGGLNGFQVTDIMIKDMDDFLVSITTEPGFPCIHRRMKLYIVPNVNEKLDTWVLIHEKYVAYIGARGAEFGILTRFTAPSTLQEELEFQGSLYTLKAIVYGNGSHFMTRYQTSSGHIYDYDGMRRYGSDRPITRHALCMRREGDTRSLFTGMITNVKRETYIVVNCLYVVSD